MRLAGMVAVIGALAAGPVAAEMPAEPFGAFSELANRCGAIHRLTTRCAGRDLFIQASYMRRSFFRWAEREGVSTEQTQALEDAWYRGAEGVNADACPRSAAEEIDFRNRALSAFADCSGD